MYLLQPLAVGSISDCCAPVYNNCSALTDFGEPAGLDLAAIRRFVGAISASLGPFSHRGWREMSSPKDFAGGGDMHLTLNKQTSHLQAFPR